MKEIQNQKSILENQDTLQGIIGDFVDRLNSSPSKNRKKIRELCHVGKFLMLLGNEYRIDQLFETPDFIINNNGNLIGLEHQNVIDQKSKEREGFFENIFSIAESELQVDSELPNFLANCYLNDDLTFQLADKARLIHEIKLVVKHHILHSTLLPNSLIREIFSMPHSGKNIITNFGAWWQKEMSTDVLLAAISHKESKLPMYRKNSVPNQWLLLVIGGLKNSSYEWNKEISIELNTKFNKIYLLEDFNARLFEIK